MLRLSPFAVAACTLAAGLSLAGAGVCAQAQQSTSASPQATAAPSFAQRITGTITVDGLAVPGVTVTVTDPASGQKYVTSTDESGRFTARVAHPGTFDITTGMAAFAPAHAQVSIPATAAVVPPVSLQLVLASQAPAVSAVAAENHPNAPASTRGRGAPAAGNGSAPGRTQVAARNGGQGARGRSGRSGGGNADGFQQLDVNQTGDLSGVAADAGASDSGIAGMNDNAATDSAVVSGVASQDQSPMGSDAMAMLMRGGLGGPGGPGGGRGRGGPGGGFGGGRGGGGGFGGRGGFNFRQMQNRFNQPHGNLSYTLSDSALNALPDSVTGASSTQNPPNAADQNYSASLTMPLKIPHIYDSKGKTSITLSFRGTHNRNLSTATGLVPTANERQGIFTGLTDRSGNPITITDPATGQPYQNNIITPGDISSASQDLLKYFPAPTPGATGLFNYSNTRDSLSTRYDTTLRINHSFGSTPGGGRGFGRFGRGRSLNFSLSYSGGRADNPGIFFPFVEGMSTTRGINARLGYNQPLFGWTNTFSLTYNRSRTNATNLYAGVTNVAAQAGITGVATNALDWGLPGLSFATSGFTALRDDAPNFSRNQTFSVSDGMIRRMGKHNVRFGGDMRWLQNNPERDTSPNGAFSFDGQYSGYDFADFLLGMPQQASERFGGGVFYFRQIEPDLYFNDNWQVKGNFTVSYGLRWEYISPYSELFNRLTNLLVAPDFSTITPVVAGANGVPDAVLKPNYLHLRPSFGFAWRTWQNMILTGGFGMAYNTGAYANMATALAYQTPFITNATVLGTATTPLSLTHAFSGPGAAVNTYGVNPNYSVGYSELWQLDVQRTVGRSYVVNLDYSGNRGVHLDQLLAPNRTPTGLLYANLPPFLYDTTGGNSLYNGGSLIVSRRMSHGVSFRARYTYSKMEDDASQIGGGGGANGLIAQNPNDLLAEWAVSNGNVTHRLALQYEWQLPYGLNHKWGDNSSIWSSAFGDWMFSGSLNLATGQPFTPTINDVFSNAQGLQSLGVSAPLRANLVAGESVALAQPEFGQYFNTAAFAAPTAGAYGDAGRNIIIGPGSTTLNTSLSKTFRMGEFRNLELRFDGNNVLNHPNWTGLDTNFNNATFGTVTGFSSPRNITFNARFRF
ncbi:MAG: carboxypeptidase regulatory-like domain-containing protein [Terriglobales bacterium]